MNKQKGITWVEILVVVAIVGVLVAIIIPNVGSFIESSDSSDNSTVTVETENKYIESLPPYSYAVDYDKNKMNIVCYPISEGSVDFIGEDKENITWVAWNIYFIDPNGAKEYFNWFDLYTIDYHIEYPFGYWKLRSWSTYPCYWRFVMFGYKDYLKENKVDLNDTVKPFLRADR